MEVYAERFPNSMPLKEKQLSAPEAAFCSRHGIHPMAFADYGYRLTPAGKKTTENSGNHAESVDILHVTARPRFGNTIIQLSNALNLARTLGVKEIWLPGFWYLQEHIMTRNGITVKNPPSTNCIADTTKTILAGDFFQRKYFFDVLTPNRLPISSFLGQECLRLNAPSFPRRELLIEIAILDGRNEDALDRYRELCGMGRCYWEISERVADAVSGSHPEVSLGIWRQTVDNLIAEVKPRAYEEASGYMRKMRDVYAETGRTAGWREMLLELRTRHKAKRRLMTVLDALENDGAMP